MYHIRFADGIPQLKIDMSQTARGKGKGGFAIKKHSIFRQIKSNAFSKPSVSALII